MNVRMNERMNELWHGMNQIEMNERDRILNTQLNNKFHTENRVKIVMKSYNRMFNHNLSLLFRSFGVFHSHIIIFIIFFFFLCHYSFFKSCLQTNL